MNKVGYSLESSFKISLQSSDNTSIYPKFTENEIVKGTVVKSSSSNNIQLLIKGKKIAANTHIPLKQGSVIFLRVEEAYPNPVLKLVGTLKENTETINISMILNGLKKNLWKAVSDTVDHCMLPDHDKKLFKALIDDLSIKFYQKSTPDLLKDIFDKSGIRWESKLKEIVAANINYSKSDISELLTGDLKGLGSKLMSLTEGKNDIFERLVSTIKNIQLLNQSGLEQEGKIFIPLPIQFPDGLFTIGQLLIHFNKNNKNDSNGQGKDKEFFRISFLLEMSNLGPLRADLLVRQKQINGQFLIVEKKAKSIIETQLPYLERTLEEKGFAVPHFECLLKESVEIKDTLIREMIHEENHNIHLVA